MVQLDELIGNKSFIVLIDFFIGNSSENSQTEVKKKTKLAKATLTKWLDKLCKEEIISVKQIGTSKLYKLNKENIIVKHLKILKNLASLKEEIEHLKEKYSSKIYLYGSAARGEDEKESDIDLLIIGKLREEEIIRNINKISEKIDKKINIKIFSPVDWAALERKDKAFYERVEKDKIEF